jgi:TrpR family transcriptional regulator, trp operon repressor
MNEEGWACFLTLCLGTRDETILSELFNLLLTHEEKSSLETRCLIIKALLDHKKPQRQMSEDLTVSIAKITRGSNELKRISPKLKKYLETQLFSLE